MKIKIIITAVVVNAILVVNMVLAAPPWDYINQDWGGIEDTDQIVPPFMYPYALCALGRHQSPVDLAGESNARRFNKLRFKYIPDQPDFYNTGYAVQVNASNGYKGYLRIGNDLYPLIQYHFHAPSEHVIGDKDYPAEIHFVHIRDDGRIAVLGVFLKVGDANPIIQTILDNVSSVASEHNYDTGITINPTGLLPHHGNFFYTYGGSFYTYGGSLTTPPCSEGVSWYVLSEPITLSAAQLSQLEDFYSGNARLLQDLNGRMVAGNSPFNPFRPHF